MVEVSLWPPGSYLESTTKYQLTESTIVLTVRGYRPLEQGYEALTGDRIIAIVDALRSLVSAYGAREFKMVPSRLGGSTRKNFGFFKLEGPFPDYVDE